MELHLGKVYLDKRLGHRVFPYLVKEERDTHQYRGRGTIVLSHNFSTGYDLVCTKDAFLANHSIQES